MGPCRGSHLVAILVTPYVRYELRATKLLIDMFIRCGYHIHVYEKGYILDENQITMPPDPQSSLLNGLESIHSNIATPAH